MAMNSAGHIRLRIFSTSLQHFLIVLFLLDQSDQYIIIRDIPNAFFALKGDIILAGMFPISSYDKVDPCGPELQTFISTAVVQAMVFAIGSVNENPELLPGIRLGLVLLDTCDKEETAVAQAIRLLPRSRPVSYTRPSDPSYMQSYEVHAVIIGHEGKIATSVSYVLGSANIASMSFITGFPELNRKKRRENKDRTECIQTKIIINLIHSQNWQDVALVYDTGEFGRFCAKQFKEIADENDVCIGAFAEVATEESIGSVLERLYHHLTTEVAVFFGQMDSYMQLAQIIKDKGMMNEIIWVAALPQTAFSMTHRTLEKQIFPGLHYLVIRASPSLPDFLEHLEQTDHRFYSAIQGWPGCPMYQCTLKEIISEMGNSTNFLAEIYDSVYIYSYAIHSLIQKKCRGAKGSKAAQCIKKYGNELKYESTRVNFQGLTGNVSFDSFGNRLSNFDIFKIDTTYDGSMHEELVGLYNYHLDKTTLTRNTAIGAHTVISEELHIRRSRCKLRCAMGEIRDYIGECCFKCIQCEKNEITKKGQCKKCPTFKWPDPATNLTTCTDIKPTSVSYDSPSIIIMLILGHAGLVTCVGTLIIYISERKHRIIKASSIELSVLQLLSVLTGFADVTLWFVDPTPARCQVAMVMFHSSFNILYAAMLVKAIRVYRIFTTITSLRRLKYTSPMTQVSLTLVIATVQLCMCFLIEINYPISTARHMPVWNEKLVELSCNIPRTMMLSFICLNTLILTLCGLYAYKTKQLPNDFNESRYMSMCIYTTIVIWVAFMPVWLIFMSNRFLQAYILAMTLLLNHGTALIFLFLPKVFAVLTKSEKSYREETAAETVKKPTPEIDTTPTQTVNGVHSSGVN